VFPGDYRSIVACNDTLNDANFRLALLQLAGMRKDDGSTAGMKATHLIASVSNQFAALDVLKLRLAGGADNVLTGIVKPVVCRFFG
jgi:hypothetical protein